MQLEAVLDVVGTTTPHMHFNQAKVLREFMLEYQTKDVLELGFRHGVSTCYMAAVLDETGGGSITTIDLEGARAEQPNIEQLLDRCGLTQYVKIHYEPTSYVWRMMKMLEEDPKPRFDFCYLDGAHNWFVDGFAFFLVDRLLRPGGWIIFDDLYWKYSSSPTLKNTEFVRNMPPEERDTPQIRKVYELLVKPHPCYSDFILEGDWAYARKRLECNYSGETQIKTEQQLKIRTEEVGMGALLLKLKRRFKGRNW